MRTASSQRIGRGRPLAWLWQCSAVAAVGLSAACGIDRDAAPLSLSPPALLDARAIEHQLLYPIISLSDGTAIDVIRLESGHWEGKVALRPEGNYTLTIIWYESIDGKALPLATHTRPLQIDTTGLTLTIASSDYDTTLDTDGDGLSNIDERKNDTDPFDPNSPLRPNESPKDPDAQNAAHTAENDNLPHYLPAGIDLSVPRIPDDIAPRIDGHEVYLTRSGRFGGEWSPAVQTDRSGAALLIDRPVVGRISRHPPTSRAVHRWGAMHDGKYLYLVVMVDDGGHTVGDSWFAHNDDALEVFIDGDNSKFPHWGDADDFHILIPMLKGPMSSATANDSKHGRYSRGWFSSTAKLEMKFATGPGMGDRSVLRPGWHQDVYEIRLRIDKLGIDKSQPFGIALRIDDDDDGGVRDSQWAWFHPSGSEALQHQRFVLPSMLGSAMLAH